MTSYARNTAPVTNFSTTASNTVTSNTTTSSSNTASVNSATASSASTTIATAHDTDNHHGQHQQQHQHQQHQQSPHHHQQHHQPPHRRYKYIAELSQCLLEFVIQLLPTPEELAVKEDVRKLLERLIRTIELNSRLLSFGSTANGFLLRNSDMDLCCLIDSEEKLNASDLVTMVGDLLERETKFHVKPLPHARIPIVKLSLDPSPGLPLGIACDIGFENRLALENTRLLLCYSMVDPTRVRTLVLFLKIWSKRRKINSPYKGTLSSYGYVLLVIYFLVHVKNPPVLPNLQQIPPLHPIPSEEYHLNGRNIWFFDDIELLRQRWKSQNTESVAELLIEFFRYYARDFSYNTGVASIRAGLLKKDQKGWQSESDPRFKDGRERNRLCIEDPFEIDYNVARCVTRDGLYLIRGEFMRASRILQVRHERGYQALAQLCEERDESTVKLNAAHNTTFVPPRMSFPPQTPYSVGSNSFRASGLPPRDRLSPPKEPEESVQATESAQGVPTRDPPEHMAPKRGKYTSPPPPEAPDQILASFESRLDMGLSLATAATSAREQEKAKSYLSSSSNSEILSDAENEDAPSDIAQEDDTKSVRSHTGEMSIIPRTDDPRVAFAPSSVPHRMSDAYLSSPALAVYQQMKMHSQDDTSPVPLGRLQVQGSRGRRQNKFASDIGSPSSPISMQAFNNDFRQMNFTGTGKNESLRRSSSGPSRAHASRLNVGASAAVPLAMNTPVPPSPIHLSMATSSPTVYYETNAHQSGNSSPSRTMSPLNAFALYQQHYYIAHAHLQAQAQAHGQSHQVSEINPAFLSSGSTSERRSLRVSRDLADHAQASNRPVHSHNLSSSTIVGPPTPAASSFALAHLQAPIPDSQSQLSPALSHSPSSPHTTSTGNFLHHMSISPSSPIPDHNAASYYRNSGSPSRSSGKLPEADSPNHSSHHHHSHPQHHSQSQLSSHQRQSNMISQSQGYSSNSSSSAQPHHKPQMFPLGFRIPYMGEGKHLHEPRQALDLASPSESPVSSGSSHGGFASASVGSGGSISPMSSPRTTDFSSPRAPSPPDRRMFKHERGAEEQMGRSLAQGGGSNSNMSEQRQERSRDYRHQHQGTNVSANVKASIDNDDQREKQGRQVHTGLMSSTKPQKVTVPLRPLEDFSMHTVPEEIEETEDEVQIQMEEANMKLRQMSLGLRPSGGDSSNTNPSASNSGNNEPVSIPNTPSNEHSLSMQETRSPLSTVKEEQEEIESVGHTVCTAGHGHGHSDGGLNAMPVTASNEEDREATTRFKEESAALSEILANMKRGLALDGSRSYNQQAPQWSLG